MQVAINMIVSNYLFDIILYDHTIFHLTPLIYSAYIHGHPFSYFRSDKPELIHLIPMTTVESHNLPPLLNGELFTVICNSSRSHCIPCACGGKKIEYTRVLIVFSLAQLCLHPIFIIT